MRLAVLAALALASCSLQRRPYTYTDQKEMSDRPGLFTGRTGAIMLLRDEGPPLLGAH